MWQEPWVQKKRKEKRKEIKNYTTTFYISLGRVFSYKFKQDVNGVIALSLMGKFKLKLSNYGILNFNPRYQHGILFNMI